MDGREGQGTEGNAAVVYDINGVAVLNMSRRSAADKVNRRSVNIVRGLTTTAIGCDRPKRRGSAT